MSIQTKSSVAQVKSEYVKARGMMASFLCVSKVLGLLVVLNLQ